jgi:uncharacterized membrane protein
MSTAWLAIILLTVGTVAIKAVGPVALGGREPPPRAAAVIALVAPALLAALVVYETFVSEDGGVELDARVVGVAAAALALVLRLPLLAVVGLAAVATAVIRALF